MRMYNLESLCRAKMRVLVEHATVHRANSTEVDLGPYLGLHHSDRGNPKLMIPCASKWRVRSVTAEDQLASSPGMVGLTRHTVMFYIDDIERLRMCCF